MPIRAGFPPAKIDLTLERLDTYILARLNATSGPGPAPQDFFDLKQALELRALLRDLDRAEF